MENKNGFMNKLMEAINRYLRPIGEFMSNQRHFASISAGLMTSLGVMIIGAFAQIISAIFGLFAPGGMLASFVGGGFAWASAVTQILAVPYNMTSGLMSLLIAFGVAYQLARKYEMKELQAGFTSLIIFLMVVAPSTTVELLSGASLTSIDTTWLGSTGMFTAIVIALGTVEVSRFCIKRNWQIKMPDTIPPFLGDSFSAMIPTIVNVIIFYGANVLLGMIDPSLNIATAIAALFMAPVSMFVGSVPGMILLNLFAVLLWTTGVHGTMITIVFILPIMMGAIATNGQLVAQGLEPVFNPTFLFGATSNLGGTGGTIGLVLLCLRSAKSEQLKAIGKVSVIPGFFNVNEPVTFGVPIIYNPIMAIPYILTPMVITIAMWIGYETGFLVPGHIMFMSLMPIGVGEFIGSLSIKNLIFPWLMIPVTVLIYYPFFKVYDKQLYDAEQEKLALEKAEKQQ